MMLFVLGMYDTYIKCTPSTPQCGITYGATVHTLLKQCFLGDEEETVIEAFIKQYFRERIVHPQEEQSYTFGDDCFLSFLVGGMLVNKEHSPALTESTYFTQGANQCRMSSLAEYGAIETLK